MNDNFIDIPNSPPVPGLAFRPFQGEADFSAMAAVLTASQQADQVDRHVTAEQIAAGYLNPEGFDPYRDVLVAQVAGEMVAYGRAWWWQEQPDTRLYALVIFMVPEWRRMGIGRALLRWLDARAAEMANEHPAGMAKILQASVSEHQAWMASDLEQAGFSPARYFFQMVRPNLDDIPEPPLPNGLELRPVSPEHYPAIWQAADETSRDEWGYAPASEERYQEWLSGPHFQPKLWQIAWDTLTGQVAGHVLSYIHHDENEQFQRKRGYTEGIGVERAWRGQGVAQALIARSLRAQKEAGMTESALVVDSANPSGAIRLYEKCGFQVVGRDTIYRKSIPG